MKTFVMLFLIYTGPHHILQSQLTVEAMPGVTYRYEECLWDAMVEIQLNKKLINSMNVDDGDSIYIACKPKN